MRRFTFKNAYAPHTTIHLHIHRLWSFGGDAIAWDIGRYMLCAAHTSARTLAKNENMQLGKSLRAHGHTHTHQTDKHRMNEFMQKSHFNLQQNYHRN